jgi:hypothetical protein
VGRLVWLPSALVCAALLIAPAAASAGTGYAPILGPGKFTVPKVRTDGLLTVGGQETLTMSHIPKRSRLKLTPNIVPPITATICNDDASGFFFLGPCLPQPLYPVPGTPRLKRNKKGRAALTFIMPAAYEFIDRHDPTQSHPIYLIDNQSIGVEVDVTWRIRRGSFITVFAETSAIVQVPPPPP